MTEINIFDVVDSSPKNFFKFEKVGDKVQGTMISRNDNSIDGYNNPQTLVDLLQSNGTVITVSIRHSKIGLIKELENIKLGQIVGFLFSGTKENVGKQPTKYIRVIHDPKFVNETWLKEYNAKLEKLNNPIAGLSVNEIFPSTPDTQEIHVPITPITPIASTVSAPVSDSEKIKTIADLAKAKLGATTGDDVQKKVVEKFGLEFSVANLNTILEKLKSL